MKKYVKMLHFLDGYHKNIYCVINEKRLFLFRNGLFLKKRLIFLKYMLQLLHKCYKNDSAVMFLCGAETRIFMKRKILLVIMTVILFAGNVACAPTVSAAEKKSDYTARDVKLLASIIFCEAGNQSFAGKVAVGCVVMNRKRSRQFPNSVEGVIRQKGQFSPVAQGKFGRELKKYKAGAYKKGARKACVKAAKAALSGQNYVRFRGKNINMRKYHFFSQRLSHAKLRIGGHDFK